MEIKIHDKVFKECMGEAELGALVRSSAVHLHSLIENSLEFQGKQCIVVPLMNGAIHYASDVIRKVDLLFETSTLRISSYGDGVESSGEVSYPEELAGLVDRANGKHVIIIDDILETGLTAKGLITELITKSHCEVSFMSLFARQSTYIDNLTQLSCLTKSARSFKLLDDDDFIVGYGLDYKGYGRNLPTIYKLR